MKLKKLTAILLIAATISALTACGKDEVIVDDSAEVNGGVKQIEDQAQTPNDETAENVQNPENSTSSKQNEDKKNDKNTSSKDNQAKPSKDEDKAQTVHEATTAPTQTPAPTATQKPTPTSTPSEKPSTVGRQLLADFNSKASSASSAADLAEKIISNKIIPFAGAANTVSEGLLTGFGNTEIKGFTDGAMFGPIIGSIPFIGYVFELDENTDKSEFISLLKNSGNLRWNVCVEAEEMVVGSSGNKIFFVMCNKSFDE